jgi:hypothetical protein
MPIQDTSIRHPTDILGIMPFCKEIPFPSFLNYILLRIIICKVSICLKQDSAVCDLPVSS